MVAAVLLGGAAVGAYAAGRAALRARATSALPGPCAVIARDALARTLGRSPDSVSTHTFTPPSGMASCRFRGQGATVTATLDSAPQAWYVFERTVVEYAQNVLWDHLGERAYPIDVSHVGLDADWLPSLREFITTDGVRIVTVVVSALPAHGPPAERVGEAVARTYLGPLRNPFH
jgi:hypothetical protein